MKIEYLKDCNTLDELKKSYRKLAMKLHPDRGGSEEKMKRLNAEYDYLFEVIKTQDTRKSSSTERASDFRNIVDVLLRIPDIEIELVGSWLWIAGNTYPVRDRLKEAGCRWSKGQKRWYWTSERSTHKSSRKSLDSIRMRYGSELIGKTAPETILKLA